MDESDGTRIGMNYTETPEMNVYMKDKKVDMIWMQTPQGTMYPPFAIPSDKRYLAGFAWFDYIRPMNKDDIFGWRAKNKDQELKKTERKFVPRQKLEDIK